MIVAAGNRVEDSNSIVRLIHNALLNRFKIIKIIQPTVEEWAEFMIGKYGDNWDKRVYAFLKHFESEGFLLKIPESGEGLDEFPTPRSWTWVALDLIHGFDSLDDIIGLVGEEAGRKFHAFSKVKVFLEDLLKSPEKFHDLSFDGKYMVPILLASWIDKKAKPTDKSFKAINECLPLIDHMCSERGEFLMMTCVATPKKKLLPFLTELLKNRPQITSFFDETLTKIYTEIST